MINAEIIEFVQTKFGVTLKDKQLHIINMLCESPHKNVFAFWPTGFGKSMLYEGRSISSRTNNPNSTTVNHTILTVVLLFNIVSLQFNTVFPSFYKFIETCSIEVFVGCT